MKQAAKTEASNIILITIDALRYDHMGCHGYHRNTSPNIDRLAARGVKFVEAISNGGITSISFPCIMASALPPLEEDEAKTMMKRTTTLAEVLKKAGYQTAAFHSNPWLSKFYGYDRGFDEFDDNSGIVLRMGTRAKSMGGLVAWAAHKVGLVLRPVLTNLYEIQIISAEEINSRAISWIESHEGRLFLWLHYMDVHQPYSPPTEYLSQFCDEPVSHRQINALHQKMLGKHSKMSQSEIETLINLYDAEIRYTDEIIGSLVKKLGDCIPDSYVIVTADHGDEFGEHGRFGHQSVYDGILRVPLILTGPGIKGGTSIEGQVSLINLAPTILDIAGISSPPSFHGKSLLPLIEGKQGNRAGTISTFTDARFGETSIAYRVPSWKFIYTESLDGSGRVREEVYDLVNDPGETRNLHGADIDEARKFEVAAKDKLTQFKQLKLKQTTDYEKQRIKAKLQKLDKL
jgi:arylsulfatase A-like enzyme